MHLYLNEFLTIFHKFFFITVYIRKRKKFTLVGKYIIHPCQLANFLITCKLYNNLQFFPSALPVDNEATDEENGDDKDEKDSDQEVNINKLKYSQYFQPRKVFVAKLFRKYR